MGPAAKAETHQPGYCRIPAWWPGRGQDKQIQHFHFLHNVDSFIIKNHIDPYRTINHHKMKKRFTSFSSNHRKSWWWSKAQRLDHSALGIPTGRRASAVAAWRWPCGDHGVQSMEVICSFSKKGPSGHLLFVLALLSSGLLPLAFFRAILSSSSLILKYIISYIILLYIYSRPGAVGAGEN